MCRRAKVVVNCCGPYRYIGEPVVRAAVHSGAHYVDVSGEPQFIETMELHYDATAREAGVYVISACGFDSIPNDMGVIFLEQNFKGTLNSVESYISADLPAKYKAEARRGGVNNYGTWASIIGGLNHRNELAPLRKKLFPERMPQPKPKLEKRGVFHRQDGLWAIPFPGSGASVVYRTQRRLFEKCAERPVQFQPYVSISTMSVIALVFVGSMMVLFSLFECGRKLLLKHPRLFSLGVVSRDQVSGTNPGYGATVVALLHSALTIIQEKEKMPEGGGVMTTGYAFRNTNLIKRLHENNLKFEIIEE